VREGRRALRQQRQLIAEWRALRNGEAPPTHDAPIRAPETEAGAEDLGTRQREAIGR
jgi:hypothetical protein